MFDGAGKIANGFMVTHIASSKIGHAFHRLGWPKREPKRERHGDGYDPACL